jgi:hypothetical protein
MGSLAANSLSLAAKSKGVWVTVPLSTGGVPRGCTFARSLNPQRAYQSRLDRGVPCVGALRVWSNHHWDGCVTQEGARDG